MSDGTAAMRGNRAGFGRAAGTMSRWARWLGVLGIVALGLSGGRARAAISQPTVWTQQYAGTAYPASAGTLTIAAGTNRMLLVAIASRTSTAATQTVSVSYGGQALTLAKGDAASSAQQHTYFFYLPDSGIQAATSTNLSVTMSGGTAAYTWVYAAVFAGVNQTTPFTDSQSWTSLSTANSPVGPFATALSMNANDWPIEVILLQRSASGTTARTITTWAANWGTNTGASIPVSVSYNDAAYMPQMYVTHRAVPTTATTDTSQHTASSTSTYASMTGISLQTAPAATVTIGNGSAEPASSSITSGAAGAIDAFSLQASSGTPTVTAVTVNLTAGNAALSNLFINSTAACTGTTYGTLASPVAGSNSITLTTSPTVNTTSSTTNLYVCGTAATVTASTAVTGNVAGVTASGYGYTDNDTTNATLTVLPVVTIGNGSAEPANATITSGQVGAIDAFSVQSSGGTATVTAVGVTLTFSAGSPLTNVFVNSSSACTGTTYGTLASPVSGANTINLTTSISATTTSSTTNLYVCGTAANVSASATVGGTLTSVTASGYGSIDNDTSSATLTVAPLVTIGNGSAEPGNSSKTSGQVGAIDTFSVQTSSGTATITAVAVSLTFSSGSPLTNVFVNSTSACTGTTYGTLASPVSGSNTITLTTSLSATTTSSTTNLYVCGTAATVAANATVTGTVSAATASGTVSTSNDTTSSTLTVTPPPTVTIGNGSAEPGNSSKTFGQVGAIDTFSVQTNGGTATITAVAVSLTFSAGTPLTNVFVNSTSACTGTTYGTLASPVSGANTITLTTSISATTTSSATNLYVCGTAATVAANATVTGTVSAATASGYVSTSNDTTSSTLTVTPPPVPGTTTGAISAVVNSCSQVTVSATYTGDTDGDNTVTFARSTDGTTFTTLTACTSVGGGANPRVCVDAAGLLASTSYWYRATFTDATGGVTGTNPITTSASVNTGVCAANLILGDPGIATQPAAATLTVGASTWTYVGQFTLAASSGTVTLGSIAVTNGAATPLATGSDLQLNLVNAAGAAVYATGSWDGSRWVFGTVVDPSNGLPVSIGTTAVTFRIYVTANYGAAAAENFKMQVTPANVVGLAPAVATTGATVAANSFATAAPAVVNEGSASSITAPMVSIVNPDKGKAVSGNFLVQIYVFSANASAISAMGLTTDGSTPTCATNDATITKDSHAYASASAAMYSKVVSGLAAGTYTLKACATNTGGTIVSSPVTVTVRAAGSGDGNMLVRDNASQLCSDCHGQGKLQTHSSESTQSKYGTWSTTCRDCHTPHSTRNLYLVKEQIVPPGVNGYQASKNVYLATKTGDSNVSGATTPASSSFANSDSSGVCQVCHTRTMNSARTFTNGSFTNVSTTVTTSSAVFAPTDVNNWIFAPDGRSYQISVYTSATQVTLASSYQGSTVTGAKLIVGPSRWRNSGNQDAHYTAASGTAACTGCHSHAKGFAGGESSGGSNCSGCHGAIWNAMTGADTSKHTLGTTVGTNDSFKDDTTVNWGTQTSLATILPAQRSCVNMCHDDHVHDLSPATTHEQDVYTDARNSTARAMTRDASGNVTAGTPAKVDFSYNATTQAWGGMCTSCHQTQVDANRPAIPAAQFSGSGHDGITSTDGTNTYTWNYTLHEGSSFNRNCTKCHAARTEGTTPTFAAAGSNTVAVHGSNDASLLAGGKSLQNAATAPFVCWNCHGSTATPANGVQGNRSNHDVQTVISKTYNHPVATTDSLHNSVTEATATYNGGQFSGAKRHVNCIDCHDPHAAGRTNHANGTNAVATTSPLNGASGVGFTSPATNWTATTTANFTWKNGIATSVAAEYELCLKCHSSFGYGTTPPTGTLGASSTAVETDQSLEFSTSNQSYHPVAGALPATDPGANGSSRLTAAQLCTSTTCTVTAHYPAGTQSWTPGQTMYCSDCHGSDTATAGVQGPHGSSYKYVLKGPNHCWPYTASAGAGSTCTTTLQGLGSNPTSNSFLAGNFCMNCHPLFNGTSNSAATWSGNIVHYNHSGPQVSNVLCVQCHILVPHGGKVSRLIATATAGLPARYQVSGTVPAVTQFLKSTTGPGGYNTSNCGTSCGGHGSVTNPETW